MHRRSFLLATLATLLAPVALRAEEKKEKKNDRLPVPVKGDRYVRLPTMALELYDKAGQYHMSSIDLILQVPEEAKFSEKHLSDKMRMAFNVIPYEEYARANPAPMVKSLALEIARKEPGTEMTRDVLISKMLFR
ncbi:hypothetical protein [Magnetospirillum fulvum]|uniref:Flagellar basal body-associated protein FliL n=1 Tax=Magnetospirillum fulvum TaxID=1082 RepID=A0A1H6GXY7_MAGFU|nr:hypothetical protein [Magnetospirillum fulvum]SEH27742.1 hypothetical protein SAMN04244559_00583 [Magnetospirillum fulvum]